LQRSFVSWDDAAPFVRGCCNPRRLRGRVGCCREHGRPRRDRRRAAERERTVAVRECGRQERRARERHALGFALRLDALPADRLAGPRLVVTRPEGEASIGIAVTSEGLVLEQTADGKTTTNVVAAATPNAWTRIILGVETNEAASAPYGRLEVAVDDDDLQVYAVMVPVHTGALTVRAGVVEAPSAYATTQIDDVMFFAH
jgi:hypothetical protein